ncbi:hypothetical protein [Methanoregula sp.]|jgi:hypothetical protein|uniref:hypothetical protein n=1 Tax=Methanoregula sp. TaxID=2052170 RepID=UPI003C7313BE
MRHRKNTSLDQPWLPIAAVIGVIAVLAIAAIFFLGGGGSSTPAASPGSSSGSSTPGTGTVAPQTTLLKNTGISSITVIETTPVPISATGVNVEVNYLGSFAGQYGTIGNMSTAKDSGDKVYPIGNMNGTFSANFQKQDSSTTHDLTVQIWKDGKAVKFASNSSAYGIVNIDYTP